MQTLETVDALDEAREWVEGLLGICTVLSVAPTSDAVAEFALMQDFRDAVPLTKASHPDCWSPPVFVDSGHRYIRRADLAAYVREVRGERIAFAALTGALSGRSAGSTSTVRCGSRTCLAGKRSTSASGPIGRRWRTSDARRPL